MRRMYIMLSIVGWAWVAIVGIYLGTRFARSKREAGE
jgi:hypothetical protein